MNELLKINYEAEQPTVSARDLHEQLNIESRGNIKGEMNHEINRPYQRINSSSNN